MKRCERCGYDKVPEGNACPSCGTIDGDKATAQETGTVIKIPTAKEETPSGMPKGPTYTIGTLYANRYRIEDFLGRGGMGSVYHVYDTVDNIHLALKILHKAAEEQEGAERFKREIELTSRLKHPSVPKVYGWGSHQNEFYFVAEFVDGHDLKTIITEKGPWDPPLAANLVAQVADALSVAHAKGIIHRDVKPHNIMICKDESVRLLDFGVARGKGAGMETLTKTGMIVGTPDYMSPEQFGTNKVDERSDIYSLGVVLYELLTGQTPFGGETPVAIALRVVGEQPALPRTIRSSVPAWMERIVMKCMEKDPKERYYSATELAVELRKPRTGTGPKRRWLKTGDAIIEDDSDTSPWALVLSSAREKIGWEHSMTLRFNEQYYRLQEIHAPGDGSPRWAYNFVFWPEQEVMRRVIDYDKYVIEFSPSAKEASFMDKMKKKLFG